MEQIKSFDLRLGGGGGLIWLNKELKKNNPNLKILLTDYPNISAFEHTKKISNNIDFVMTPIDARSVPKEFNGLRTLFLSFHHFNPNDVKIILQNAIDTEKSIAIFEAQERSVLSLFAMLFLPITVLLITPFIQPFKICRIIFTYLIPIIPLFVLWDGIASSLRAYSVKEMNELVCNLNTAEKFNWEI